MKMSSNNDWGNRPRAIEEMQKSRISASTALGVIVGVCAFVAIAGLLTMLAVHVLRDAGAIDWSLSYRQAQLLTLCVYVLQSMYRFLYKKENTPT